MFLSLTASPPVEKKEEVIVADVPSKTENSPSVFYENDHCTIVGQKLNEIVDEDIISNSAFVSNIPRNPSIDSLDEAAMQYYMMSIAQVNSEDCGVPMSIFDNVRMNCS